MGWFKKKSDPISERAKALNEQIARLEAEIQELSSRQEQPEPPAAGGGELPRTQPTPEEAPSPADDQPRLRSTALPHSGPAQNPESRKEHEPIFEELSRNPFKRPTDKASPQAAKDLGTRRSDFTSVWSRFKRHFRGPATSNPKLVSYLAAGSIQGLRPLRYEKRVARNRFILLLICLVLIMWGIIAIVMKR